MPNNASIQWMSYTDLHMHYLRFGGSLMRGCGDPKPRISCRNRGKISFPGFFLISAVSLFSVQSLYAQPSHRPSPAPTWTTVFITPYFHTVLCPLWIEFGPTHDLARNRSLWWSRPDWTLTRHQTFSCTSPSEPSPHRDNLNPILLMESRLAKHFKTPGRDWAQLISTDHPFDLCWSRPSPHLI